MTIKLKKGQTGQQYASAEDKRRVEEARRKREENLKKPEFVKKEKEERRKAERRVSERKPAPKPAAPREPIEPVKEKTGIAKLREEDTITGKAIKVATSWKTTLALVATLATMGAGSWAIASARAGAGAGAGRITMMKTAHEISAKTGKLMPRGTVQFQRAIGKASHQSPKALNKIFHTTRDVAQKYATNPKSMALTTKIFIGAGLTMGAVALARDVLGTYPFAGFIKEEALQTVGLPMKAALDAGDLEGAQEMLDYSNEVLLMSTSKIPYKNVLENVKKYFAMQGKANIQWQRLIDERTGAGEEFESEYEKSAREREERDIAETEKFAKIKKEGLEEMEWKSEYYALIREGKHEEAKKLLKSKS